MQLRIPGPTPLPEEVLEAMNRGMISHRGAEFRALMLEVTERLKHCFQTESDVLVFPAAGTGGLEAAIANLFSPGDTVIALTVGAFGERFAEIAERFGLRVIRIASPWGQAANLALLQIALEDNPQTKAVLMTHNETSTGVQNDVEAVSRVIANLGLSGTKDEGRTIHASRITHHASQPLIQNPKSKIQNPLLMVDAISSLGAADIPVDRWGVDVAITASQKAWMAAPGLTMLSVSERAWQATREATLPRFYWDFAEAKRFLTKGETPYTPAVSLLYGLRASLRLIMDEGLSRVFRRHERLRDLVRAEARRTGLEPFAHDSVASRTVTALNVPEGLTAHELTSSMRERGIIIAGGQGAHEDRIIRIGHMGHVSEDDLTEVMSALRDVMAQYAIRTARL
jgi:aspartate aminotransferase-like enzyme